MQKLDNLCYKLSLMDKNNFSGLNFPSFQSAFGLSLLVFLLSDVEYGVGPFLSVYLKLVLHWDAGKIGIAIATVSIVAIFCQLPSGYLVDVIRRKRAIILISCLLVMMGSIVLLNFTTLLPIIIAQIMMGISITLTAPTIASITMGLYKRERFPKRTTINEFFNHSGNVFTAFSMAVLSSWFGYHWILYTVIIFSILSLCALAFIKPQEIDYYAARELPSLLENTVSNKQTQPISISKLLTMKPLIIFSISIILLHFSNASQLILAVQQLETKNPSGGSIFMAGGIIIAQAVMGITAFGLGYIINKVGRKPLFLIAFLILPFRAILYTLTNDLTHLLFIQILDGICAGIFGILVLVTVSDIAAGTGRFNLALGLTSLSISIGAGLSNLIGGFTAKTFGYHGAFLLLGTIAIIGSILYAWLMPETRKI
jgi:MFS family permease